MPQFPIQSPTGGVNRVVNREGQPPNTCWDAVNVMPYDRNGRKRITQRSGLAKWSSTQLASTKIQGMIQVPGLTYAATTASTVTVNVNSFANVPATVSTSGNSLTWPSNYTTALSDATYWTVPVVGDGLTLSFDVTLSGLAVAADASLWVGLNPSSTATWANTAAGSTAMRIVAFFDLSNDGFNGTSEVYSSTSSTTASNGNTVANTPGVAVPCSITWDSGGNVVSVMGGASTTPTLTITPPSTASYLYFFGGTGDTSTQLLVSNIKITQGSTVSTGQFGYNTTLVAVAGGNVFFGDIAGNVTQIAYSGVPSTALINSTTFVSMCYAEGIVFIADGSSTLWSVNVTSTASHAGIPSSTVSSTTAVVSPYATASTITPVPPHCSLCCTWRGRIVLAGDSNNSAVWYMSRPAGDYSSTLTHVYAGTEWDVSQSDPAAAIDGNNAGANGISEPITALIPFSNDYLKFGCAHSMYMAQGDPAGGGSIVNVSQNIGVAGKDAWTIDPQGTLYFVASGGLYSCRPAWEFYWPPEPVTLFNVDRNFSQLDPGIARTTLAFDPDLHYLHVFMSAPPLSGTLGQHLTMDARSVGQDGPPAFWPQQFPSTMGPSASLVWFANGNPNSRTILIGGNDGYIRTWTSTALDDDGTSVSAGITFGPYALAGVGNAALVQGLTIDMGETPIGFASTTFGVVAKLSAGPDAYSVTEYLTSGSNPKPLPIINITLDRRQKTMRQRLRGGWFSLNLASLTEAEFSFESAVIDFVPSGKNRERRT